MLPGSERKKGGALRGGPIDVGDSDQYNIHYGLRQLHSRMSELGIEHEWEEFPGTHSGIDHRLDLSLPWIVSKIQSTS